MKAVPPTKDVRPTSRSPGSAALLWAGLVAWLGVAASSADTFTVTTNANSGAGSLRRAINDANGTRGADIIVFHLAGTGPHRIDLLSPLPAITDPVSIDGTTQPGYAGLPLIELNGADAGPAADGLWIIVGNSSVRGLAINRFAGYGLRLESGDNNQVVANFVGTDATGTVARTNGAGGILVLDSGGNNIGGREAQSGNLISGNNAHGIAIVSGTDNVIQGNGIGTDITGSTALPNHGAGVLLSNAVATTLGGLKPGAGNVISGNDVGVELVGSSNQVVQGNCIGTDAGGTRAVPNGYGVVLRDAPENLLGGDAVEAANLISGNTHHGLWLVGPDTQRNAIQGNRVGTDSSGQAALPNAEHGILLTEARGNLIGGFGLETRNVISGNGQAGVCLVGASSNLVFGNFIGTDARGMVAVPNALGIDLDGAPFNAIGTVDPATRNVISGNTDFGLRIRGARAAGNVIDANFIGTDASGSNAVPNGTGLAIQGAPLNSIGSTDLESRNLISGNLSDGLHILGADATNNVVQNNFIGTDVSGAKPLGNRGHGVRLSAPVTTLGGVEEGAGNVISGNRISGVQLDGAGATGNVIQGNLIGTDASGARAVANATNGITVDNAPANTLGGTELGAGNVISGNGQSGISLAGSNAVDNVIQGNRIGTDRTGTFAVPNTGNGLTAAEGADRLTLGGAESGARNLVAGNRRNGVDLRSAGAQIQGNFIGTDFTGTQPLPNQGDGVVLRSRNTLVGGSAPGAGNRVAFNGGDGVRVSDEAGPGHAIFANAIFGNRGLGINLQPAGESPHTITLNDPGDADTGPNDLQNFPVITNVALNGGLVVVRGTLNSQPDRSYGIDFYANTRTEPAGPAEGELYLGFTTCPTDNQGWGSFVFTRSGMVSNQSITATATDLDAGDTSEFSAAAGGVRLVSVAPAGADLELSFTTWLGLNHRLEYATALGSPVVWTAVPGAANVAGTGGVVTRTDSGAASAGPRFYRVRLLP